MLEGQKRYTHASTDNENGSGVACKEVYKLAEWRAVVKRSKTKIEIDDEHSQDRVRSCKVKAKCSLLHVFSESF